VTDRVLVVDDDPPLRRMLERTLAAEGYEVSVAADGGAALVEAERSAPDVIVLDVAMPAVDGLAVARRLRDKGDPTPILMLTARDAVPDRVAGLEAGADDYLVKPFAFSELVARIRTVLRRGVPRQTEAFRVADLDVDTVRHVATRDGRKLDLTPKEFSLLALMARRAGEVLTRTLISEQVWDMNFDSDSNVVDVHIRRLRAKVDDPFASKLIHTVRGVGYVLEYRS
jgi:two-component system copper resistance phosphate regulon response regulator CusR